MALQEDFDVSNMLIENCHDKSLEPLISAILKSDISTIEQFLIDGLDVNSDIGEGGLTILAALIASTPDPELVKLCLEYGADATQLYKGLSVYELALHKDSEIYKVFFTYHPVDRFSPASVPCHAPCLTNQFKYLNGIEENNEFIVAAALRHGAEPRAFSTFLPFPIFCPVANQNVTMLTILLESGVRPNVRNRKGLTPLHVAAQNGSVPCCRLLLRHGAAFDVESPEGSPLQVADGEALVSLLQAVSLLFHMARHGDLKYVKSTLKQMTDEDFFVTVNCLNRYGRSLMQEAFRYGYPDVAEAVMALRFSRDK